MKSPGSISFTSRITDVFKVDGRWCVPVVTAFFAVNLIVLVNAILHDPRFGYDAPAHLAYVRTLAGGRLPTPADSHEFFSPPLPYAPAAIFWKCLGGASSDGRAMIALKAAQFVQVFCSIVLCWSVLAIARLIRADKWMMLAALVSVGMVPAYYRTFAMIRGEPMMVTLLLLGAYLTLRCFAIDRPTVGRVLIAGVVLGGAVLSRQWAFFALPALGLVGIWRLVVDPDSRKSTTVAGFAMLVAFTITGGWFYAKLHRDYGSIRAFNRQPDEQDEESAKSKSPGSLLGSMVRTPVRHAFDGHPFWLFYADTWGDYSRYFLISARDQRGRLVKSALIDRTIESGKSKGSNAATMPAYLGRVCAVSIVPTFALLGGLGFALSRTRRWPRTVSTSSGIVIPTITLMTCGTIAGYIWFVATYPNVRLDTVKASYLLQIFPLLAITAAAMWCALLDRWPKLAYAAGGVVLVIFVHNLPSMVTRYTMW